MGTAVIPSYGTYRTAVSLVCVCVCVRVWVYVYVYSFCSHSLFVRDLIQSSTVVPGARRDFGLASDKKNRIWLFGGRLGVCVCVCVRDWV